jgi:hypothetical protein
MTFAFYSPWRFCLGILRLSNSRVMPVQQEMSKGPPWMAGRRPRLV